MRVSIPAPRALVRASCLATLGAALAAPVFATDETSSSTPALAEVRTAAEAALARPDLVAYRGWIKFLLFEAEHAGERAKDSPAQAEAAKVARLAEWMQRITDDPTLITRLRGVQEWAYESPVDGSGQPFKINIPTDYDPARPAPISVIMHGYSGNHLEHSGGAADRTGDFELYVLGRARGGWYVGLSRADVIQVLDYIEAHWNIDPLRVRLAGGSMGGGGTFKLGSRYPHRFAAGQITCGYLQQEPVGNLLTFPIYAVHSDDDPVVTILQTRAPFTQLRELGGQAILDETTGYGHASWDYAAGGQRSAAWVVHQKRPASTDVRHIDYTAIDGEARRGWWAEAAEWGPEPRPARFALSAGANNTIFAELTNITRLNLRLAEAPIDRTQSLKVVVGNSLPIELPAPLPDSIIVARGDAGWAFESEMPDVAFRLHTPGGPIQVYDGSPLLIVYGTRGTKEANTAMHAAAVAASKSSHPDWLPEGGEAGADGVPHAQNLYGWLNIKADTEVTDADLARCNLVLIGHATENALVARMAARLPARFEGDRVTCNDGTDLAAAHAMLGLVHHNPLAPQRLVFWVAANDPAAYRADATVPALGGYWFIGADMLLTDATSGTLIATRCFDSRWHWTPGRDRSPALSGDISEHDALAFAIAEAARRATGTEFAVAHGIAGLGPRAVTPGVTRAADLAALLYDNPIDVLEVDGATLLAAHENLASSAGDRIWGRLVPAVDAATIDPSRVYRIALPMQSVGPWGKATFAKPRRHQHAVAMLDDAVERFLGR